jgi:hypothetical protein
VLREATKEQVRPRALSDVEPDFVRTECGRRSADVRPDWQNARSGFNAVGDEPSPMRVSKA